MKRADTVIIPISNFPRKEDIIGYMISGSTTWWEDDTGEWEFQYTEREDMYDRIFNLNHKITCIRIYDHYLTPVEKGEAFQSQRHLFTR